MNTPFRQVEGSLFSYSHMRSSNMITAHFHDTYEIYYLLSGSRRHLVRNELFDVYPGDFVLIPSITVHRTLNVPHDVDNKYHSRYLLSPSREMIPDIFLPLFDRYHYRIPKDQQPAVMECFSDIARNCKHTDLYSGYANQANLVKLLAILARTQSSSAGTTDLSESDKTMRQAAAYIKEHCDQPLTLLSVATEFGFSREYFSTLFKASTGFGFSDYLNQMQISRASTLLLSTDLPITEISSRCGFNDSNYFTNVFRRNLGITPSRFRTQK